MQRLSIADAQPSASWRLTIVDRGEKTEAICRAADRAGIPARVAKPVGDNPFFNKWLFLQAWPDLAESTLVIYLDWDIVQVRFAPLPDISPGAVACRRNPADLYAFQIRQLSGAPDCPWATAEGLVRSSVNGGVIMADLATLRATAEITHRYLQHPRLQAAISAIWAREQIALSLAVGEIGLIPLDDAWNVTPLSDIGDGNAIYWHYNDSHEATRALKSRLLDPDQVRAHCRRIPARHHQAISKFMELHDRVSMHGVEYGL